MPGAGVVGVVGLLEIGVLLLGVGALGVVGVLDVPGAGAPPPDVGATILVHTF